MDMTPEKFEIQMIIKVEMMILTSALDKIIHLPKEYAFPLLIYRGAVIRLILVTTAADTTTIDVRIIIEITIVHLILEKAEKLLIMITGDQTLDIQEIINQSIIHILEMNQTQDIDMIMIPEMSNQVVRITNRTNPVDF